MLSTTTAYARLKHLALQGDGLAARSLLREATRRGEALDVFLGWLMTLEPTREAWREVCTRLEGFSAETRSVVLDFAQRALESWPSVLRMAPSRWTDSLYQRLVQCAPETSQALLLPVARGLRIQRRSMRPYFVTQLSESALLRGIEHLELSRNQLGPRGAARIADAEVFSGLRTLALDRNLIGDKGMVSMAHSPHMHRLSSLSVEGNRITSAGLKALAQGPHTHALRVLRVGGNPVGVESLSALLRACPDLRELSVKRTGLDAGGLEAILDALPHLEVLELDLNPLADAGARVLAQHPHTGRLRRLSLAWCDIGEAGARVLARSPGLTHLESLVLSGNPITSMGSGAWVGRQPGALRRLWMTHCEIESATPLVDGGLIEQLEVWDLSDNPISDLVTTESPVWAFGCELRLKRCNVYGWTDLNPWATS